MESSNDKKAESHANAFEEDKKNAYEAGMNWHIAKLIKVDELISALAKNL